MITGGESEIRWEKDESRCLFVPTKMGFIGRTLSVLLFELTHLHVIGYCPPHGSNPGEVQLFPAAAWVFGCGLAWGRGDRKLRNGLCHYRRTGRCGSRKLRACRVDHGSSPSTGFQGVKEALVLLHPKGVRNRSSCLREVPGEDAHHPCH